jgi:hypothetical protein
VTDVEGAVERLLVEHERAGSPLARYLRSGVADAETKRRLAGLGIEASPELLGWFGRLDGVDQDRHVRDRGGRPGALGLCPGGYPFDLDTAVAMYGRFRDGALALEASASGAMRADDYWRSTWLPIISSEPVWIAVDTTGGASPVWRVDLEPDYLEETAQVCPDLASFLDAATAAFQRGDYRWDEELGRLVMADGTRAPEAPTCG